MFHAYCSNVTTFIHIIRFKAIKTLYKMPFGTQAVKIIRDLSADVGTTYHSLVDRLVGLGAFKLRCIVHQYSL